MPWFYVDDGFANSKPVMNMPDRHRLAACGLWVLAGSWSAKELTDGFVPTSQLRTLGARPTLVAALTEQGPMNSPLCELKQDGIQFNNWAKWQETREKFYAKREKWAKDKRGQRGRNYAPDSEPTGEDVEMSTADAGWTGNDVSTMDSAPYVRTPTRGYPNPDPSSPSKESSGGGVKPGNANSTTTTTPPSPYCDDHPEGTTQPCIPCRNRRIAREQWDADMATRQGDAEKAARARRVNCPICEGTGMTHVDFTDPDSPLTRCLCRDESREAR